MALDTAVNEAKWKLQSGGTNAGGYSSTFQRRTRNYLGEYVYQTKNLNVSYLETYSEYKYYALTESACTNYIAAHPELSLQHSRQDEFGNSFTLSKRTSVRSNISYVLADVPETGA